MAQGEIILYRTADGVAEVQLRAMQGTVWLSQAEIAALFNVTPQNVTLHIRSLYGSGELAGDATCKEDLQVRSEGTRTVQRAVRLYSLDMILAIGYRVRSPRGSQFRQWATVTLREYLVKGFVMNDERLKEPDGWDYFDELLARIRDIRASEKRFYQKIRDLLALSADYRADERAAQDFFAEVQNKMLYAVTQRTAAELIVERADDAVPNMNLDELERRSGPQAGRDRRQELSARGGADRAEPDRHHVPRLCRGPGGAAPPAYACRLARQSPPVPGFQRAAAPAGQGQYQPRDDGVGRASAL